MGIASRILVPLDGSVLSESAIPLAIALAGSESSDYTFVSIAQPASGEPGLLSGQSHQLESSTEITPGILNESQTTIAHYVAKIAGQYSEFSPTPVVGAGDAATEIERAFNLARDFVTETAESFVGAPETVGAAA